MSLWESVTLKVLSRNLLTDHAVLIRLDSGEKWRAFWDNVSWVNTKEEVWKAMYISSTPTDFSVSSHDWRLKKGLTIKIVYTLEAAKMFVF